jgi:hypothetical protein
MSGPYEPTPDERRVKLTGPPIDRYGFYDALQPIRIEQGHHHD